MRNHCDNQLFRNHSFSRLRRKNKQEFENQNDRFNIENKNQEIKDITKYSCKNKNRTMENDISNSNKKY